MKNIKTTAYSLTLLVGATLILTISFYLGYFFEHARTVHFIKQFKPLRLPSPNEDEKYIRPLIGLESPDATTFGFYDDLKKSLVETIQTHRQQGDVSEVSVYFRDLNTSLWFGIDEDLTFYPASLLKLPYAFAAYKHIEEDQSESIKRYVYTNEIAAINRARPSVSPSELVVGQSYTLKELIMFMMEKSDNGARDMLAAVLSTSDLESIFAMLGVNLPQANTNYEMTTEKYARFLRMLYSASYLNETNSNELLTLLTKTDFSSGLTKYLPPEIEVAHKYGVLTLPADEKGVSMQQLHDCGIVYYEDAPYVLCIMTKGVDQKTLAETIADISKKVFDYTLENQ